MSIKRFNIEGNFKKISDNNGAYVEYNDIKHLLKKKKTNKKKEKKNQLMQAAFLRSMFKTFPVTHSVLENRVKVKNNILYYLGNTYKIKISNCPYIDGIYEQIGNVLSKTEMDESSYFDIDFSEFEKDIEYSTDISFKDFELLYKMRKDNHTNPVLSGISIKNNIFCATDSIQLVKLNKGKTEVIEHDIVIHGKIFNLFKKTKEDIEINFYNEEGEKRIILTQGDLTVIPSLITDSKYVLYENIIFNKKDAVYNFSFNKTKLKIAINKIKAFKLFEKVRLHLNNNKIESIIPDSRRERVEVSFTHNIEESLSPVFAIDRLYSILNFYDLPEKVTLYFNRIQGPFLIEWNDKTTLLMGLEQ